MADKKQRIRIRLSRLKNKKVVQENQDEVIIKKKKPCNCKKKIKNE